MKTAALILMASALNGDELRLAPEGRPLKLEVEKAGLLSGKKHHFEFPDYTGVVNFDPANPAAATVTIEIAAGNLKVMDDWIDEKDRKKVAEFTRSAGMLDSSKHPKMLFRSTRIERSGEDAYRVTGDLVVRGVAKPVALDVKIKRDTGGLALEGRGAFPMTQFGLKPPSAALGAIRTKDLMTLRFEVLAK